VARRALFTLGIAFGRLADLGGAPGFWAPQITAGYGRAGGFGVRVSASGSAPAADVSTDMGRARIRRGMLTIGAIRTFRADRTVRPLIGLGAGVQRLSGEGTAAVPEQAARNGSTITGLVTASAGVVLALGARFAAFVEADLLLASSQVEIRLAGTDVATFDRLSLYTHAGLLATF
jgi:hypothetical protein